MERHRVEPRANWQRRVEDLGFLWHTAGGEPYWSEDAYYSFSGSEIERIEAVSEELCRLFVVAGQHVIDQARFAEFGIPKWCEPLIVAAWNSKVPALNYGRFDLGLDRSGTLKLFEFNCDTPTSLVEASVIQWFWKQDVFPSHDQFNGIHEALVARWRAIASELSGGHVHFAHIADRAGEDTLTTAYMIDLAGEVGLSGTIMTMRDIGWKEGTDGGFFDLDARPIASLYKLYPWEWLVTEPFGQHLAHDAGRTHWIEPIWKMIWSNKAILPILWELFPEHPNLLWAGYEPPAGRSYVCKPRLGREGGNVTIVEGGVTTASTGGRYNGPVVYQELFELPSFDGKYPVIGSWVVDGQAVGIGVREGGRITSNRDRFVPHIIAEER